MSAAMQAPATRPLTGFGLARPKVEASWTAIKPTRSGSRISIATRSLGTFGPSFSVKVTLLREPGQLRDARV